MNDQWNSTILCVDDEEDILNTYRDILLDQKDDDLIDKRRKRNRTNAASSGPPVSRNKFDYKIISARSGEEAIAYVQNGINKGEKIAVGFFDMKMPGGIDGMETIKRILKLEPGMLCVVVTAYTDKNLDQIGSLFSSQDQWIYMSKPFSRFEVEQTAYSMISSWNRRRKEEKNSKKIIELNANLQEQVSIKTYELQKKVNELNLINDIGKKINSLLDLDTLLETIIHDASKFLHAVIGSILLTDESNRELVVRVASGPLNDLVVNKRINIDENTVSGYVVMSRKYLLIPDMDQETGFKDIIQQRKICSSLISVPLLTKGQVIGVMHLGRNNEIFTEEELHFFAMLADQASVAIENAKMYRSVKEGHLQTIQALAKAIDAKDSYTRGHSDRVTEYAVAIAHELDISDRETEMIKQAGLLHDIGKIGLPEAILNKPYKLSLGEFDEIRKHPSIGSDIIAPISFYPMVKKYVRHHHEKFDGSGYPDRIKGEDIPLGARILAVADAYDAMTSDRSYRNRLSPETAIKELQRYSGTQFDPVIVEAFVRISLK